MRPQGAATFVVTGEQCILAIEGHRANEVFDVVAVDLDTTVGQESLEAVPVAVDVGQLLTEARFRRDTQALRLKPLPKGCDQRRGTGLAGGQALAR